MAMQGYKFYIRMLYVSLPSERSQQVREDKMVNLTCTRLGRPRSFHKKIYDSESLKVLRIIPFPFPFIMYL